ncbi:hypothetical protein [Flavihumibacter solisilvae]|jgi:hypothetical protein|uniref:Uncharacterized protein n=1 Tax=Flavihumibacter solisilvae TaxID=1349421 RepID=A0A0C1L5T0_9BACT|nr:hypothetical protein [Flavihumibacter solisilvae]KIC94866.1 hypothetical protein OI18_08075 [Flavihumibacter solisilvae]
MDKDIRISHAEFNEQAMRIFFPLLREFRNEAKAIERNGSENIFQLLRARYVNVLKQRLERSAGSLLDQCKTAQSQGLLRNGFSERISYYLKEFTRNSESF